MQLFLFRKPAVGSAVYGRLEVWSADGKELEEMTTLENASCLIAVTEGRPYRVVLTRSPKFGRVLPLVCGVTGRDGIRFHQGTRPEHSTGCILLSSGAVNRLILLVQEAIGNGEKVVLHVGADCGGVAGSVDGRLCLPAVGE